MRNRDGTFAKGNPGYWLGKKRKKETVKKMADKLRGRKYSPERLKKHIESVARGSKQVLWKGESASMVAIHAWVRRYKGEPDTCIECGKGANEWANKSGKYKRSLNDFVPMCYSCHRKMDKRRNPDARAVFVTALGETKTLAQWAEDERCLVSYSCLRRRIKMYNYDPETAIIKPSIR